jgi:hypothetical protein
MTQVPRGKEPERLFRDAITRANALIEGSLALLDRSARCKGRRSLPA